MESKQKQIIDITKTIYNEARGQGNRGMDLVADTIQNRYDSNVSYFGGKNYSKICSKCYEGYLGKDPNPIHPGDKAAFQYSKQLAEKIVSGSYQASTNYTHFANRRTSFEKMEEKGGMIFQEQVGNHYFFIEKGLVLKRQAQQLPSNQNSAPNFQGRGSGGLDQGLGGSSSTDNMF